MVDFRSQLGVGERTGNIAVLRRQTADPNGKSGIIRRVRIAIVGNSGSGKSTLSRAIARDRAWPQLDLDTIAWEPHEIAVPRNSADAEADLERFCATDSDWVVEGCYSELIAVALRFSPLLILLDPGMDRCVANCRERPWEPHKFASRAEQDQKLPFLLNWVREYYTRDGLMSLQAHEALFDTYGGPKRRLRQSIVRVSDVLDVATQ